MNAVILCDGEVPDSSVLRSEISECDLFIAADGGANTALELNLMPDIIIGDMDSYSSTGDERSEIIQDTNQETNDLEKALQYAIKKEVTDIKVFGATGERLDHTLKNLSVLKQFHSAFNTLIFKDKYSVIFLINSPFTKQFPIGTSVSLFPLSGRVDGITTKGLQYPLNDEFLENGVRDGTSNRTVEKKVEIESKKGDLLLFINHKKDS